MPAPIPDAQPDSVDDWLCVKVVWPKDAEWLGVLFDLITAPTRGRYWNEQTGNVVGAQHKYAQIFAKNWPLVQCESPQGTGGASKESDAPSGAEGKACDMGCNACLRWSNGVLEHYWCGEWVAVPGDQPVDGAASVPAEPDAAEQLDLDDAGAEENINCRLATAAAIQIERLHLSLIDVAADNPVSPHKWVGLVRGRLPELDIDGYQVLWSLQYLLGNIVASGEFELVDTSDDDFVAYLATVMRPAFSDENYTVSPVEKAAAGALLLTSNVQQQQGFGLKAAFEGAYWSTLWAALEGDSIDYIELMARQIPASDLDCEVSLDAPTLDYIIPAPAGAQWVIDWDFRQSHHNWQNGDTYWQAGVGLVSNNPNVSFNNEAFFNDYPTNGEILAIALDEDHYPDVDSEAIYNGLHCPAASPETLISSADIALSGVRSWTGSITYSDPKFEDLHIKHDVTLANPAPLQPSVIRRIVVFGSGDVPYNNVPVVYLT